MLQVSVSKLIHVVVEIRQNSIYVLLKFKIKNWRQIGKGDEKVGIFEKKNMLFLQANPPT